MEQEVGKGGSSELSRKEHAKFLLFQMNQNENQMPRLNDSLIQCEDGSLPISSLVLASLSQPFAESCGGGGQVETRVDCPRPEDPPILVLPSIQLGELLLFFKYLFSVNVAKFYSPEDKIILKKVGEFLRVRDPTMNATKYLNKELPEKENVKPTSRLKRDLRKNSHSLPATSVAGVTAGTSTATATVQANTSTDTATVRADTATATVKADTATDTANVRADTATGTVTSASATDTANVRADTATATVTSATATTASVVKTAGKTPTGSKKDHLEIMRLKEIKAKRLNELGKLHKTLNCRFCGEPVNLIVMMKHMKLVHPDCEFNCQECLQEITTRPELEKHIQSHTNSPWYIVCDTCDFVALSQYQLQNHRKSHNAKINSAIKCKYCEKEFLLPDAHRRHELDHESGKWEKKFQCIHCDKSFSKQHSLGRHLKSHFKIKNYSCDECHATFVDFTRLKEHKWIHLEYKKFSCPVANCTQEFRHRSNLKLHLSSCHQVPSINTFPCTLCNRSFSFNYKLRNHLRFHEMEEVTKHRERVEEGGTEQEDLSVYVCATCKREYRSIADLGAHCQEMHNSQTQGAGPAVGPPPAKKQKMRNLILSRGPKPPTGAVRQAKPVHHHLSIPPGTATTTVQVIPPCAASSSSSILNGKIVGSASFLVETPPAAPAHDILSVAVNDSLLGFPAAPGEEAPVLERVGEEFFIDAETKQHLQLLDNIQLTDPNQELFTEFYDGLTEQRKPTGEVVCIVNEGGASCAAVVGGATGAAVVGGASCAAVVGGASCAAVVGGATGAAVVAEPDPAGSVKGES